jgi:hypothetical protein
MDLINDDETYEIGVTHVCALVHDDVTKLPMHDAGHVTDDKVLDELH